MNGGDADGGRIYGGVRGQKLVDRSEGGNGVAGGCGRARCGVGVYDGRELHFGGGRGFELAVDAEMVAAEGTGPDDGDAEGRHVICRSNWR